MIDEIIRMPKQAEIKYERKIIKLSELKFDPNNPNVMTELQEQALTKSLEKFGYIYEIVADKNTMIIADGEHRVKRMLDVGITEAEVILYPFKDDQERRLFRQTMNKLKGKHDEALDLDEYAKIIDAGLKDELKGLLGWSERELNKILDDLNQPSEEDEMPPVPRVSNVKMGEVYILGRHRVMCGDATKAEDVSKLMNGNKADMVFTDPPYGIGYEYNTWDDRISEEAYENFCKIWFNILKEISEKIIMTVGLINLKLWYNISLPDYCAVWYKKNGHSGSRISKISYWEPLLFFGKFSPFKRDNDIFEYYVFSGFLRKQEISGTGTQHPCPKPVPLISDIIINYSDINNIILDVFGGSGSTLISCENTNRTCFMMEIDPVYVAVILDRWQKHTGKKAIREDDIEWDVIKNGHDQTTGQVNETD